MERTNTKGKSRREFIKKIPVWAAAGAGLLASAGLLRQFIPRRGANGKKYRIGHLNDFPLNAFTYVPERQLYVYRDNEGIRALSAVCTHLGCIVEKSGEGFLCPCHGSCYNGDGEVVSGAASRDLPWYAMYREPDGQLVVDLAQPAGPGQKLIL